RLAVWMRGERRDRDDGICRLSVDERGSSATTTDRGRQPHPVREAIDNRHYRSTPISSSRRFVPEPVAHEKLRKSPSPMLVSVGSEIASTLDAENVTDPPDTS